MKALGFHLHPALKFWPNQLGVCSFSLRSNPFFLNARVQKENGDELAEEKEALYAFSPKFKSRASEACTAFKLDEDT
ncbi:hypothetical protein [Desulfobaculum bizertense]|uniref:Uncharacterized protein n=1 Tax=Desulfobaculum bizertense DSM 18034 TaxID=1121442 RepID=A0A1T4VJ00_9BACT|nr:hypothetical protein [Desulfobaculum bizertense]SKA64848.1 hypothetical protein SAMN02745702_00419 [Desulfobaculum bizertense DSM 18034]